MNIELLKTAETVAQTHIMYEPTIAALDELSRAVETQSLLTQAIDELEALTDLMQKAKERLSKYAIPKLLAANNVKSMKTTNGTEVSVKRNVYVRLPKVKSAEQDTAVAWLREHGGDALIKEAWRIDEPTPEVRNQLVALGALNEVSVNTNSLKAFISELLGFKKGIDATVDEDDVPAELGLFVEYEAKVK